jgi:hypothetical protein
MQYSGIQGNLPAIIKQGGNKEKKKEKKRQ